MSSLIESSSDFDRPLGYLKSLLEKLLSSPVSLVFP